MLDARELEPALTAKEILLRDSFVCEYLKDYDAFKSCLRLGFTATYAVQWAQRLLNDGYVQRKITYLTSAPQDNPEQERMDRAMVENTLRKIMMNGSDSARVAAVREFRTLKGWDDGDGAASEDLVEQFKRLSENLPT